MQPRRKQAEKMSRPPMSLEELGLLRLLEKVGDGAGDMDAYVRHGLLRQGLITTGTSPRLTSAGEARLADLRTRQQEAPFPSPGS